MSSALGIAAVTAVLESMLNSVFNPGAGLGSVSVSAYAPDVVQPSVKVGSGVNQVNLFLHQVRHNPAWRNVGLPSLAPDGITILKNPPLALDLHYLLTAYSTEDGFPEALLGFALLMLHQYPTLSRGQVTNALSALPASHPLFTPLQSTGLAQQIELLKITPDTLGREEMAWIWTALKADYRPTYAFQVSVVLLYPPVAETSALPVFHPAITLQPGPPPLLSSVTVPKFQSGAALTQQVTLTGQSLANVALVRLTNQRFGFTYQPDITPSTVTSTSIVFNLPNDPTTLPAGVYMVACLFTDASGDVINKTNTLPLGIAPAIDMTVTPPVVTNDASGTTVTVNATPFLQQQQTISLSMGGASAPAQLFTPPTTISPQVSFLFPTPGLAAGIYVIRLQVDGVESAVTWTASPPGFTSPLVTVL